MEIGKDKAMKNGISRRLFYECLGISGFFLGAGGCSILKRSSNVQMREETMLDQYLRKFKNILTAFKESETKSIEEAAYLAVLCMEKGGHLYSGLIGHLFYKDGGEIAADRIGNPALFRLDSKEIEAGDFLLTMSPAEAVRAKEKGVMCVGFTSPYFRKGDTPPLALTENPPEVLQNPGDRMLSEICDVTVECHVPCTDGILESSRLAYPAIPAAGQVTLIFYWALAGAITERLARKGRYPVVAGG